jgi:hypothetical protein
LRWIQRISGSVDCSCSQFSNGELKVESSQFDEGNKSVHSMLGKRTMCKRPNNTIAAKYDRELTIENQEPLILACRWLG